MNSFLGCTKTYETVVLFGKSTDTYDVAGKKIASAPYDHVTRALVEQKLATFRGKIKQMPPIYSALKIDGMKAYDYARTGKELPRELEARDMEVQECELVEWFEGSRHEYRWPATEASVPVKDLAMELVAVAHGETQAAKKSQKRKLSTMLDEDRDDSSLGEEKKKTEGDTVNSDGDSGPIPMLEPERGVQSLDSSQASSISIHKGHRGLSAAEKARLHTHEVGPLSSEICPAPAARIRVTVSSGFYVRSFAHDLGIACGSLALMATLFRSRQAEFDASSALTYEELEGGEDVWGPTLENMLDRWNEQHLGEPWTDDRDRPESSRKRRWSKRGGPGSGMDGRVKNGKMKRNSNRDRRNTSSGED
jgi:tRNA pseudouridine55 synthase